MNIAALTIPAIFTAVDRLTAPFKHMNSSVSGFARNAEVAAARADRAFNKMLPSFGEKTSEVVDYAKGVATVATAAEAITFSATSILDYEDELANLKALTGATGEQFESFKLQIAEVAKESKKSSVDVVKAFGSIANNMPELLDNAKDLSDVTKASILLGKAARMETEAAGLAVTDILNQYSLGAKSAGKLVEMLAAGSVAGSSEINDTQEALKKFGTVAANINVTPLESIASIELVSKFEKGAEAGTKLRNILTTMSQGQFLPPKTLETLQQYGVDINKVSNSSIPFTERLKEIGKISADNAAVTQVFGKENLALATGLLQNAALLPDYISKVDSVGEATRMANENTNTLRNKIAETVNTFVTYITTLQKTSFGLKVLSGFLGWVADNMGWMLDIAVPLIGVLLSVKAAILGMALVAKLAAMRMWALEFVAGVATVANRVYATSCFATEAGMYGMATASFFLETSLLGLSLVTGGVVVALGLITFAFIEGYDANVNYLEQIKKTKDGLYELPKALSTAEIALKEYTKAYEEYIDLQNFKAYLDYQKGKGGMTPFLTNLTAAFMHPIMYNKAITEQQSRNKNLLAPNVSDFGLTPSQVKDMSQKSTMPAVNNKVTEQNVLFERIQENSQKEKIELSYNNMPSNVNVSATAGIAVKGTTTMMGGNV